MSLSSVVQRAVKKAFTAADDLALQIDVTTKDVTYDPSTGEATTSATTSACRCVIVEDDSSYMDLTSVPKHSITLMVDAATYFGRIGSELRINSIRYKIVDSQPMYAGATAVAIIVMAHTI